MKKEASQLSKYIFWAAIIILLILSYLIIRPYLMALIAAFILAYLAKPIHSKIQKVTGKRLAALSCILLTIIIIILPFALIITRIIQQANTIAQYASIEQILEKLASLSIIESLNMNLEEVASSGVNLMLSLFTSIIKSIPSFIILALITLWGMYTILVNWDFVAKSLKKYLPFEKKEETAKEIDKITKGIVYGTLLLAIIEFILAGVGFGILGIKYYLFFAALMALFAFVPGIGPVFVWGPLAVYHLIERNYYTAAGVIAIGLIISIGVEMFIKNKIISKQSHLNPLISFVGIIGGVPLFGIFGFIIGPLILFYALKILEKSVAK